MPDITNFGTCVDCNKEVELKTDGSCVWCGSNSVVKRHAITELDLAIENKRRNMFTPIANRIVVQRIEEKRDSVIVIPDFAKEKNTIGEVVSIGPEVKQIKYGDTVLFGKFSGSDFKVKDQEYLVLTEDEVLVVMNVK